MGALDRRVGGYALLEELGRGGSATVYRARAADGAEVALKLLHSAGDARRLLAATRELAALRELGGAEGLVPLLAHGVDPAGPFLVLPFMAGGTLRDRLRRGPLEEGEAAALGVRLGQALGALHRRGLVHRDVKPENVLFDRRGLAYLADLGLARPERDPTSLTRTGDLRGTAGYMAPEQLEGSGRVTPAADVYALALVLLEGLIGRWPWAAAAPLERLVAAAQGVPPEALDALGQAAPRLRPLLARALDRDPARRPPDGNAFAWALRELVPDDVAGPARRGRPRALAGRVAAVSAVAAAAVALGVGASGAARRPEPPRGDAPAPTTTAAGGPRAAATPGAGEAAGGGRSPLAAAARVRVPTRPTAVGFCGERVVVGDADGRLHLWTRVGGHVASWQLGPAAVLGVASARDGTTTAVWTAGGGAAVVPLGPWRDLQGSAAPPTLAAAVRAGGDAYLFVDLERRAARSARGAPAEVLLEGAAGLALDPEERRLLVARQAGGAVVLRWAGDGGGDRLERVADLPQGPPWRLVALAGPVAAGVDAGGALRAWRLEPEVRPLPSIPDAAGAGALALAVSPDGARALVVDRRAVRVFDLTAGRVTVEHALPRPASVAALQAAREEVAVALEGTSACLVRSARAPLPADADLVGHAGPVVALARARLGLLSGSADGTLRRLEGDDARYLVHRQASDGAVVPIDHVVARRDGAVVAVSWRQDVVALLDGETGAGLGTAPAAVRVTGLDLSPDGRHLYLLEGGARFTRVSCRGDPTDRATWSEPGATLEALCALDGDRVAVASAPAFGAPTGRAPAVGVRPSDGGPWAWTAPLPSLARALAVCGGEVLAGCEDGRVRALAVADGALVGEVAAFEGAAVAALSVGRAGARWAAVSSGGDVVVWDVARGAPALRHPGGADRFVSVLVDGDLVVLGRASGEVVRQAVP